VPYHLATTPCELRKECINLPVFCRGDGWRALRYPLYLMLVIAHRGFFGRNRTENTLEAFQEAVALGANGIEFDLRLSKDGELVIVHDKNLHRIAGDAHAVAKLTAEELAQIPLRHGGSIVTLNDVTAGVHMPTILDIEIKHKDTVEPLIRKLGTSASLRERAIISSFQANALAQVKQAHPDVRTLLLVHRWPFPLRGKRSWGRIRRLQPWGVALPITLLTARRASFLKQFGAVGTWDQRFTRSEAKKASRIGLDLAIVHHVRTAAGLDVPASTP